MPIGRERTLQIDKELSIHQKEYTHIKDAIKVKNPWTYLLNDGKIMGISLHRKDNTQSTQHQTEGQMLYFNKDKAAEN